MENPGCIVSFNVRNCGVPTTVEEYSCLTEARDRMLDTHLACFPPLIYRHMARYPWATRAECTDEQSVKGTWWWRLTTRRDFWSLFQDKKKM